MIVSQILYSMAWVQYVINGTGQTGTGVVPGRQTCNTPACHDTAKRILDYMDPKVDPCDDFYKFACGRFLETKMPPDQTTVSAFTKVNDILIDQLRTILSEPITDSEPQPHRSMRQLYSLCMDEDSIDKRGVTPALKVLQEAGGWPVLGRWAENQWNILDTEIILKKLGLGGGSLMLAGVSVDPKENSRRVITVDQGSLPLKRALLLQGVEHPTVQAYHRYMVDVAVAMGAYKAVADRDLWQSLLFEVELAKIMSSPEDRTDFNRMYNLFTLESLQNTVTWVNWYKLFRYTLPQSVSLRPDQTVLVFEVEYYKKLQHLVSRFPKRVIANYMMWDAVKGVSSRLTRELGDRSQEFFHTLTGASARVPRWRKCVGVASRFSLVISSLYIKRFFKREKVLEVLEIVEKLRQEMNRNIDSLDWMEPETKMKAHEKAEQIFESVAYPEELLDDKNLEVEYKDLKMNDRHYFEAMLDFSIWSSDLSSNLLHEVALRKDWRNFGSITSVNAYYDPMANSIRIPAGILHPPFFTLGAPQYVNYGILGTIVGHEIIHGFDHKGCQFDGNGNMHNWWDETSKRKFNDKKECLIKQYSNYKDNDTQLNINGRLTQGEIVADNGGLKMAYNSWMRLDGASQEAGLPGLEQYTNQQLFMISSANMWCNKYRPGAMKILILTDEHPPPQFRVNGILQNFPVFSEVFQCAKGRPMNPERKCVLW